MKMLADTYGDRFFETTLDDLLSSFKKISKKLQDKDLLVVRTQDPDAIGENRPGSETFNQTRPSCSWFYIRFASGCQGVREQILDFAHYGWKQAKKYWLRGIS
jgi:hypothetical protein